MDVREKLVEIVKRAAYHCLPITTQDRHINMFVTDLLAHGVTVQEWILVKDRLPDDFVDVLTCDAKGNIHMMWHHQDFTHPFNVGRSDLRYYPVTHWMPLPQPPKGE